MKVIITGASGMVGEGVMLECLNNPQVEQVLVVGRRACGTTHPRLKEIIHKDFYDLAPIENELKGYDACFFCLGTTSIGLSEEEYYKISYTLTLNFANTLCKLNSGMTFCYVSGAGTSGNENSKNMWIRVKSKTENDLQKLPFKQVFNFRPGIMTPTKGMKNTQKIYYAFAWLVPVVKLFSKNMILSLSQVGKAMINSVSKGYHKSALEVSDIRTLSEK